ncbi:MAG TPA: tripartite tricarboxylate transporter substrate binding protein [Burkholderiales bacterium]|nr:tripartite tricarboxylate transporter substrate binding protein [Burkholderiales bacterium]
MKLVAFLLALCATTAAAFPTKPVRVIVAFTPGGVTDIIARTLMPKLADFWGQPVVVENRPGAGGSLAAQLVARAPADGHTLLVHSSGYSINAALNPALPYDPRRDFVDVAALASQAQVLVVNPTSGIRSVADLIAAAKARPGEVTYGSAGIGSGAHFNAEKFRLAAGIEVLHIPYKGGAEAINDTVAGRLAFTFNTVTLALPYIRDGRLLVLGVSSTRRSSLLPDVPTIAESGVPGFEFTFWNGLWAPSGTPASTIDKIAGDLARVVAMPDVRERLARLGAEPMAMTPAEFARFVRAETEAAERIVRIAGIKPQ